MAKKVKLSDGASISGTSSGVELSSYSGSILKTVLGHERILRTIADAIASERLPSTLIFSGSSGIGKKRAALGLAQTLLCERVTSADPQACGVCGPCVRTAKLQSECLLIVEPQGAGIKIEQAQNVLQFLALRHLGRARVIIIDDAHLCNPQAGNALLKSLEEPPPQTYFFLITSHLGGVLATIRSRSQTLRFHNLSDEVVRELTAADDWIVRAAGGSIENARRLGENADEWASVRRLALHLLAQIMAEPRGSSPETQQATWADFKEKIKDRSVALFAIQTWGRALRDFAYAASVANVSMQRLLMPDQMPLIESGRRLPARWLHYLAELCLQLEQDIHRNVDRTLAFEALIATVGRSYAGHAPHPLLS